MSTSIVFIDSRVANYQTLIDGLNQPAEVFILDDDSDGLSQIAARLQGRTGIDSLHIISHGSQGALQLGNTVLSNSNLTSYNAQLSSIGSALTDTGDILLYGCNVGEGAIGVSFIQSLARTTSADIAASNDATGAVSQGGNWTLEVVAGQIDTPVLVPRDGLTGWDQVLSVNHAPLIHVPLIYVSGTPEIPATATTPLIPATPGSSEAIPTAFTEQTPIPVSSNITLSDPDGNTDWNGGRLVVQIGTNWYQATDRLRLPTHNPGGSAIWLDPTVNESNVVENKLMAGATQIGSANGPHAVDDSAWNFTFNANATNALVQDTARAVLFNNSSDNPDLHNREVTFTATDVGGLSASATQTITITAVDDTRSSPTGSDQLLNQHQTIDPAERAHLVEVGAFFAVLAYGDSNLGIAHSTAVLSDFTNDIDEGFDDSYRILLTTSPEQLGEKWEVLRPVLDTNGDSNLHANFTEGGLYNAYIDTDDHVDQYHTANGITYGDSNALLTRGENVGEDGKSENTLVLAFRGTDGEDAAFLAGQAWTGDGEYLHYEAFRPLIEAALNYASDPYNDIQHIVVSGHSLGGAMVDIFTAVDAWRFAKLSGSDLTIVGMASSGIDPSAIFGTDAESFNPVYDHSVVTGVKIIPSPNEDPFSNTGTGVILSNPSEFYFGADNNLDRVFFPLNDQGGLSSGYNPNGLLFDNRNFDSLLMNLPNIDNGDVDYGFKFAFDDGPSVPNGFGAHHNSAIYWANLHAYLSSPLLPFANQSLYLSQGDSTSYQPSQKLVFGIGDYAGDGQWFEDKEPINDQPHGFLSHDGTLQGTTGNDFILGLEGDDVLQGNNGDDLLDGGSGDDWLEGGDGKDILFGGSGRDILVGGSGANTYVFTKTDGNGPDFVTFGHNRESGVFIPRSDDVIRVIGANFNTADVISDDSHGATLIANQIALNASRSMLYIGLDETPGYDMAIHFYGGDYGNNNLEWWQHLKAHGTNISIDYNFKAADGYLSGAAIYLDANHDGIADPSEDTGITTDSQGNFTLPNVAIAPIIVTGGTNIDTGIANTLVLTAPEGAFIVNPLTTLVQTFVRLEGVTSEQAESAVKVALHIDSEIDLATFDPLGQAAGNATALYLQQQAAKVAVLATVANDQQALIDNLVHAIAANTSTPLDLANSQNLASVLGSAITPEALSHAAAINQAVDSAPDLNHISAIQQGAFNNQNDAPTGTATAVLANGTEDTPYLVSAASLLAGFADLDGDSLAVANLTTNHASVSDNGNGTWTLTPAGNYNGPVALNYDVIDSHGGSLAGVQAFSLQAVDDPAVVGSADVTVQETNAPLIVNGVLTISDVDSPANFVAQPNTGGKYGVFTLGTNGTWSYKANLAYDYLNVGDSLKDTFQVKASDGTASSVSITIAGTADTTTVHIGDAPVNQSGTGGQWAQAWSQTGYTLLHKADHTNGAEAWSAVKLSGVGSQLLSGGDIFAGDLGVSGQSATTSTVKQEIDGKEALRVTLPTAADSVTLKLANLFTHDDGSALSESGLLRLLDATGHIVAEKAFYADAASGAKTVTLAAPASFTSLELIAGAYNGAGTFVYGGYSTATGGFGGAVSTDSAGKVHGSDFLVDSMDFVVTLVGVP